MSSDISNSRQFENSPEKRFRGVVVPMVSPASANGSLDDVATIRLMENLLESEVEPFLFGTTGEASSISFDEKLRLARVICPKFVDHATLYFGISSNSFSESINLAQHAADLGVKVAVANLPSYYALTGDQMLRYFEMLAESIPLPVILYNIPSTTRMSIPLVVVEKLSRHPNIVGLKDSERDGDRLRESTNIFKNREDFSHFIGWAAQSVNALRWGSDGIVPSSGNIVPRLYRDLYYAVLEGHDEVAQALQEKTDKISLIYQKDRNLGGSLAALKVLLNEAGLCDVHMFPPLTAIGESEQAELRRQAACFIKKENLP
ncbi:MAG: dihydrodipicolinate synthase family protein [Verrucomicrobiae bacterium]|nr:dihydrodipicolinate synthase family protein [Verrucomicrobiae bacterium]